MLPDFKPDTDYLPPGNHHVAWPEFVKRYGYNKQRQKILNRLQFTLQLLRLGGGRRRVDRAKSRSMSSSRAHQAAARPPPSPGSVAGRLPAGTPSPSSTARAPAWAVPPGSSRPGVKASQPAGRG